MTDCDAWNDFTRALREHLNKVPFGSTMSVLAPPGVEIGIGIERDLILASFRAAMALPPDGVDALRHVGWKESQGEWQWVAFRDETANVDVLATRAIVHALIYAMGVGQPDAVLPGMMIPPAAPVKLDTTGLRQDRESYVDTSTGAVLRLFILDRASTAPYWLNDLDLARRYLARQYAARGCLIEANPITVGAVRGIAQIYKLPLPGQGNFNVFGVSVCLAKATQTVEIVYFMDETHLGFAHFRELTVMAMLGKFGHRESHPYDSELDSRLPFLRADDEMWDDQFPGHPLTYVRAWLRDIDRIVTVDPAFAALPDFQGTRRQAQDR
jgi:hypothetical protein